MREFYQNHKNKIIWVASVLVAVFVLLFISGQHMMSPGFGSMMFGDGSSPKMMATDSVMGVAMEESFAVGKRSSIIEPPFPPVTPSYQAGDISDKKVIRNASLSLVVNKIEKAIDDIKSIADSALGFVQNSSVYDAGDNKKGGNITIRVPSKSFDETVKSIKNIAIKVSRDDVNADDVTERFVDMEVRIKNMKAEEEQYVAIMKRAVKIEDVLNVAQRLADVRTRIESMEGQLNYLARQVEMSTINISLISEAEAEVFGVVWSPIAEIKEGVRNMLESIVDVINKIIAFVFKLPAILLWIIIAVIVIKFGMKVFADVKRKHFNNY